MLYENRFLILILTMHSYFLNFFKIKKMDMEHKRIPVEKKTELRSAEVKNNGVAKITRLNPK